MKRIILSRLSESNRGPHDYKSENWLSVIATHIKGTKKAYIVSIFY